MSRGTEGGVTKLTCSDRIRRDRKELSTNGGVSQSHDNLRDKKTERVEGSEDTEVRQSGKPCLDVEDCPSNLVPRKSVGSLESSNRVGDSGEKSFSTVDSLFGCQKVGGFNVVDQTEVRDYRDDDGLEKQGLILLAPTRRASPGSPSVLP